MENERDYLSGEAFAVEKQPKIASRKMKKNDNSKPDDMAQNGKWHKC